MQTLGAEENPSARALSHVRVVLCRPQGPINLGLVCRASANLGVAEIRLVDPGISLDHPDARRFAMAGKHLLKRARIYAAAPSAVADCTLAIATSAHRRQGGKVPLCAPGDLGPLLRAHQRVAVVFGNEPDGLSNTELAACQATLRLSAPGSTDSYNLSHAVVVTLYLLSTLEIAEPLTSTKPPPATQRSLAELHAQGLELLERFGYFRRTTRQRYAPILKRLLDRLDPGEPDVHTLRGMLAQLLRHAPPEPPEPPAAD